MSARIGTASHDGVYGGQITTADDADAASSADKPVRACTNCVRAKAKCIVSRNSLGKCERCYNMKKDCQPSPPMRKRRKGNKQQPAGKVEILEEKIDGLVTLLRSTAAGTSLGSAVDNASHETNRNVNVSLPASVLTPAASSSPGSTSTNLPFLVHPTLEPSIAEAESYLIRFRTEFVEHLPFIAISPSTTAYQLRQESPLLWLCIMTVATPQSAQQITLSKEFRGILGREAYVEGTRNMDLLLAVLVYATWDRRYCLEKPLLTSFVQLAIAISYDMGLDKPPHNDSGLVNEYDLKGAQKPSRFSRYPTLEERRALLGCFMLSSVPTYARKGESLRWTAYCEECLLVLGEQNEVPSDELLVRLVRLRLISEKATDIPWSGAAEGIHLVRPSVSFYLKSLQAELQDLKSHLPSEMLENRILLLELHSTELCVHEIGMSQASHIFAGQYNQRFECLFACLQAIKSWTDVFLSIPPAQYVGFSVCVYAKMARCLVGLWRLTTCEHSEWNRSLVGETLDVSLTLELTEKNFERVKEAANLDWGVTKGTDSFSIMASRLRSMKDSWDAMTTSATGPYGIPSLDDLVDFSTEFSDVWNW